MSMTFVASLWRKATIFLRRKYEKGWITAGEMEEEAFEKNNKTDDDFNKHPTQT